MITMKQRVCWLSPGLVALCAVIEPAAATPIDYSWAALKYATCEGVGAAGSFRVHVSGDAAAKADGSKLVTALFVFTSSAAFTTGSGSTSGFVTVRTNGTEHGKTTLVTPSPPAIVPQPKPDETHGVVLPENSTISVPAGSELRISASAAVTGAAGTCALGTSVDTVPLP